MRSSFSKNAPRSWPKWPFIWQRSMSYLLEWVRLLPWNQASLDMRHFPCTRWLREADVQLAPRNCWVIYKLNGYCIALFICLADATVQMFHSGPIALNVYMMGFMALPFKEAQVKKSTVRNFGSVLFSQHWMKSCSQWMKWFEDTMLVRRIVLCPFCVLSKVEFGMCNLTHTCIHPGAFHTIY